MDALEEEIYLQYSYRLGYMSEEETNVYFCGEIQNHATKRRS